MQSMQIGLSAVALVALAGVGSASVIGVPVPGTVAFSNAAPTNLALDTSAGAGQRARAYIVNGDWSAGGGTAGGGDPWSAGFRTRIPGLTDFFNSEFLNRAHGGVNNSDPFQFSTPSYPTANQGGFPRTMLPDIPAADLGGTVNLAFWQTLAGSDASMDNVSVDFYTDAIVPVPVSIDPQLAPVMPARPFSLTETTVGNNGNGFSYQEHRFTAPGNGTNLFHVGLYTGGVDGYLFIYSGAFDPNNPLQNLIGLDDDGDLGILNSSSLWIDLVGGQEYTLVASTFIDGAALPTGLFTVAGVPAPGAVALMALGGLAASRRRRA